MANEKSRQAARPSHAAPRMRGRFRAQPGAGVGEDEGISTIRSGQGARVTTRKNAAEVADKARKNAEKRYFERHPEAKASRHGPRAQRQERRSSRRGGNPRPSPSSLSSAAA